MKSLQITVCVSGTLFFSLASVASAATNYWINASGGDLAAATNWSGGALPTPDSFVAITNANDIALTLSQPLTLARLYLGKTGGRTFSLDATLTLSNQTYMTALSGSGPARVWNSPEARYGDCWIPASSGSITSPRLMWRPATSSATA